ncbi:NAD-dependent epimerase/dehydratase family protein [Youngiibacter multivorans]|uniref:UDP-glucose 4-epimerase n=1 Tax=Youngiibacter multivorans TaxID=937251 RepID=A0ABS4G845_9CLOT|nr:NAD-dependent epimerase/dehydratase family protein [Youngiibacter multivorans]MBP1920719.1 UDP-glucose 4-epimerase [Youngiibacter multivorans]
MKYTLILGGAGFIGSNLIHEYVKLNRGVISFNREQPDNGNLDGIRDKVVSITGDLGDSELLRRIFREYEIEEVVHLVSSLLPASPFYDYLKEYDEVTIPTMRLMKIMQENSVRKLIFLSSGGTVYGSYKESGYYNEEDPLRPINYYGLSKCNLEEYIRFEGRKGKIDYLILRASNPFGRFQNLYGKQGLVAVILGKYLSNQEVEIWGDGTVARDYIPIGYLCRSIISLSSMNAWNETFNIGSGVGVSVNEIIKTIEDALDIRLKVRYKEARSIDSDRVVLNIDKLKSFIDVEKIDLGKSILDFYKYIRECENDKR